ncbi:hypothetical protein CVT24_009007 [Panaeolus cyanescens]|uniref:Adenylyl cyclase-associated protein n=1 Tax=Panaeolus cyanescens TaxID=181874 RepID=A0A409YAN0_9AGAR|nr:hypothetical protein CVT24_009007 [Panaeolus cyanescens]
MSLTPALRAATRAAYRDVLRAASITFSGDPPVLQAFKSKIRSDITQNLPSNPEAVQERITFVREVADVLRKNIVQGTKVTENEAGEGLYRIRMTKDTELGDNESIKNPPPIEPTNRRRRKSQISHYVVDAAQASDVESTTTPLSPLNTANFSALKKAHRNRDVPILREEDLEERFEVGREGNLSIRLKTAFNCFTSPPDYGLEAAASRFEDIAVAIEPTARVRSGSLTGGSSAPYSPTSTTPIGTSSSSPAPPAPSLPAVQTTPESVTVFRTEVIDAKLKPFVALTNNITGPSVKEMVTLVQKQYELLEGFLMMASSCQKPAAESKIQELAKDLPPTFEAISRAKESGRRDRDWFDHLQFIAEGVTLVAWFLYPNPAQYITDTKDSVVYYGNKLKKIYKEKDPKQIDWVNAYVAIFDATAAYVKKYHTTGLSWNPKGISVDSYKPPASSAGAPPAPPPPPPPPKAAAPVPAAPSSGGAAAVFAQLNRGEEVTKGLRKVDKSEMTHKNPALRAGSVVPASSLGTPGKKPVKPTKPQALAGKKPPKFALEGTKWIIEYHENESVTVEETEINQAVNIFNCKASTIIIKGKVNTVNIYNCQKTSVLVHSVVASIGITASPSFQIQILGSAPMIQIDQTDSGQVYLSRDSLSTEITTAKCSAINISLPVEGEEDGVFEEQPVPEMLKTVVSNGKLITTVVEHSG